MKKKLIGGRNKDDCGAIDEAFCSVKTRDFLEYMNTECSLLINKQKEYHLTDISGALSKASQIMRSQTEGRKYLVIFSDMFEYRFDELPVTKIKLEGVNVLVVCAGGFNKENNTDKICMSGEEGWTSKLTKLGAKSVSYTVEGGSWPDLVGKEFFDND